MDFGTAFQMKPTLRIRRKWALLALPLAAALFLLSVAAAEAHAAYLRSEPGNGAVVRTEPGSVEIWFTQDLFRRQGENWIRVFGPDGGSAHDSETQIDDDDRRHMWVELQSPLAPGEYRVEWRSLSSEDGDDDEGEFVFTLDPEAQVTSTPMLGETDVPTTSPAATDIADEPPTPIHGATPEPTSASDNSGSGCSLGLSPAGVVLALGLAFRRRRS